MPNINNIIISDNPNKKMQNNFFSFPQRFFYLLCIGVSSSTYALCPEAQHSQYYSIIHISQHNSAKVPAALTVSTLKATAVAVFTVAAFFCVFCSHKIHDFCLLFKEFYRCFIRFSRVTVIKCVPFAYRTMSDLETDCFRFTKHEMFKVLRANMPEDRSRTQNIIECKDDMLFAWNSTDCNVLCLNWRVSYTKDQQLIAHQVSGHFIFICLFVMCIH